MTRDSGTPINAFLSYAHATENEFKLVDPLVSSLMNQVKARANRDLKIWKDTDDIPWGSKWREAIEGGIKGASVFIVLATQHYLDSEVCRQEFNDFMKAVDKTGKHELRKLLLPILPIDAPAIFHEEAEDEIARTIANTQYIEIEDAVIDGPQSPAWSRAMKTLSQAFIRVVEDVEKELSSEIGGATRVAIVSSEDENEVDGVPGFIDRMSVIEDEMESMQDEMSNLDRALKDFPEIAQAADLSGANSAKQMLTKLSLFARNVEPISAAVGNSGQSINASAKNMDENLRLAVTSLRDIQTPDQRNQLRDQLNNLKQMAVSASEVGEQMTSLLSSMRQIESSSVVVRNALRPFRRGISDFRDALHVMQTWGPDIIDES